LSWNAVVGDDLDPKLYVAFQILDYALINAPGAPVKQALLDAGIGKDIMGGYNNGILQPYFNITAKETDPDKQEAFVTIIRDTLKELADQGMDTKSIQAGLNYYEFR
jgi:Zn-dependent M16 (insulinase) family peptidase